MILLIKVCTETKCTSRRFMCQHIFLLIAENLSTNNYSLNRCRVCRVNKNIYHSGSLSVCTSINLVETFNGQQSSCIATSLYWYVTRVDLVYVCMYENIFVFEWIWQCALLRITQTTRKNVESVTVSGYDMTNLNSTD